MRDPLKRLTRRVRENILRTFGRWETVDGPHCWEDRLYARHSAVIQYHDGCERPFRLRVTQDTITYRTVYFMSLTEARVQASEMCRLERLKSDGRWNTARILAVRAEDARIEERRALRWNA